MAGVNTDSNVAMQKPKRDSIFSLLYEHLFKGKNLFFSIVFILIAFLVLYPILLLFINSFKEGALGQETGWGIANWVKAFTEPDLLSSLITTVTLAITTQSIGIIAGVTISWIIARTNLPGRNWLEFGFWIIFFMPTLPLTQAWILLLDPDRGLVNKFLESIPFLSWMQFDIFTWWGIVWVHLMTSTIAVKVMLLTPAFRNMDSSLEEASRVNGAGNVKTMLRIVAPLMAPSILVVFLISFIRALEAFEVELILGAPQHIDVFSTKIYRLINASSPEYGAATALGSTVLILMLPLIIFQQWVTTRGTYATVSGKFKSQPYNLGTWRWIIFAIFSFLIMMMTVIPLISLLTGTFMKLFGFFNIPEPWTLNHWTTVLNRPDLIKGLQNTLILCFSQAMVAMIFFSIVAYVIVRTKFIGRGFLDFMVWLPSTLPGIVVGLGMLWLFLSFPLFKPIYGTIYVLLVAVMLGGITTGTQVLKSNLNQIGNELEEASWASGASWWYTYRRIILPLIAPAMAVVGILGFAITARATSSVVLLVTSDTRPLSILQLSYMGDGSYEAASVVGVIIMVLTVGIALLGRILGLKIGVEK